MSLESSLIRANLRAEDANLLESKVSTPTIITMVRSVSTACMHGKAGMLNFNKKISMTLTINQVKICKKDFYSDKGSTGTSLLHKYLYPLRGFDVLKHTVIDVFHTILLNLWRIVRT